MVSVTSTLSSISSCRRSSQRACVSGSSTSSFVISTAACSSPKECSRPQFLLLRAVTFEDVRAVGRRSSTGWLASRGCQPPSLIVWGVADVAVRVVQQVVDGSRVDREAVLLELRRGGSLAGDVHLPPLVEVLDEFALADREKPDSPTSWWAPRRQSAQDVVRFVDGDTALGQAPGSGSNRSGWR